MKTLKSHLRNRLLIPFGLTILLVAMLIFIFLHLSVVDSNSFMVAFLSYIFISMIGLFFIIKALRKFDYVENRLDGVEVYLVKKINKDLFIKLAKRQKGKDKNSYLFSYNEALEVIKAHKNFFYDWKTFVGVYFGNKFYWAEVFQDNKTKNPGLVLKEALISHRIKEKEPVLLVFKK
ncbi:MAG: hypothetical protein K9M44_01645 [Candidatus Pacebacteria bacterium]|nr:hypothetical protein [Candidatus Paceibacterota bacterium]